MQQFEIIRFSWNGWELQEPMALITNWMIAFFAFFACRRLYRINRNSMSLFGWFYLSLGFSTFLGGLGHLFFRYTGIYGKFPSWTLGVVAGVFIGKAVLEIWNDRPAKKFLYIFLLVKSCVLLTISLLTKKFVFVTVDAILTYLLYCGFLAWKLWKEGISEMRYLFLGVLVLLPSAFIFLMNLNFHRYLNRDDLSHLLMLACIVTFFAGARKWTERKQAVPV